MLPNRFFTRDLFLSGRFLPYQTVPRAVSPRAFSPKNSNHDLIRTVKFFCAPNVPCPLRVFCFRENYEFKTIQSLVIFFSFAIPKSSLSSSSSASTVLEGLSLALPRFSIRLCQCCSLSLFPASASHLDHR